jgi:hypothetical protein
MRSASSGVSSIAAPHPWRWIWCAGQPMLNPTMAQRLSRSAAASRTASGSVPKSWMLMGVSASSVRMRAIVLGTSRSTEVALTISLHTSPAPCWRHRTRKGRSENPAMGESTRLFGSLTPPMTSGRSRSSGTGRG